MPHCYSTVSNMRRYGQQLQNQILLFYCIFLSPLPHISLSPSTLSHFFSLCHSLSLPSPPYLRKLLKITPVLAADLTASCSSPHRRHPQPSSPTFRSLLIGLWVWDLGWVSMWVLGQHFGSVLCGLWVEVLGRLGWGFRPIVGWVWLVG